MCGILYTNDPSVSRECFLGALQRMSHRGPDVTGCYLKYKNHVLGHNRLKIIDLDDRSNQPFWSSDKRYAIIFNGEIYNFEEIASEYNIQRKTTGDTEVLISLFSALGPKMLGLLNGMFAIIILDTLTNSIFAARDRLGIKPLYYLQKGITITMASEIDSILKITNETKIDDLGLRQYRKLRTFFNGRTAYSSIKMFPAGHYMFENKIKRYWELPIGQQDPPDDDELRVLIKSAVDYRCISDVPVGSYLSGGIDSTIIAGLASKPCTWTVGFEHENEFEWARLASKKINSIHSEVLIRKEEFISLASFMIKKRKEPLSVPNEVLLYKMTREVKKKNTVILSGEGADELFFGYDRIFRWADKNRWDIKEFNKLYSYGSNDDLGIVEDAIGPFLHYTKAIDIVASFFQIAHLHGLLRRLDNATMLCSVEARVPFIDHRLVERMAGTPFDYRMRDGVVKAPLKRIFKEIVPCDIIYRTKIGFPVPLSSIPFSLSVGTPMDNWLEFNLNELERCHDQKTIY
ncbi:asparagine synthase (glutamine-hydrolyzing) [Omnitrophica bacterium]|nr:asparagine synthase (glutamine-hydrolyzing) [Candidatus Omnitrophota bacterium]